MALSLRRCVCGIVSCDEGKICLTNQIDKQRTSQTRASCPVRRSDQEDGYEIRHTGAQRGTFLPSTTSGYNLSTQRVDVAVPAVPEQQRQRKMLAQDGVWETSSEVEHRRRQDSVQQMSAGRSGSVPLVLPILRTECIIGRPCQQETSRFLRHSPVNGERLGSHEPRPSGFPMDQAAVTSNRPQRREDYVVESWSDNDAELRQLVHDNTVGMPGTSTSRQQGL